ncbi:hypothetical protein HZC32_02820, partial [Candidatus Woesearchaeota archaeon]|nr:hypothetical protein [Candidatus Woesearchaeota archaeon]
YAKANVSYLQYLQSYGGPGKFIYTAIDTHGNSFPLTGRNAYSIQMVPKLKQPQNGFWTGVIKSFGAATGAVVLGVATGGIGWVALGGIALTTALGYSGVQDIKVSIYGEREFSSINLDTLQQGQYTCGTADLAGE